MIVAELDLHRVDPHSLPAVGDETGPPANIEAEQALLGALLYDNSAYERITDKLKPQHFYEPFHGRMFDVLEGLMRKGNLAEPILVSDHMQGDPAFAELGGVRYLADLVDRAPPAVNANDYAEIIYDRALRRDLIRIAAEVDDSARTVDTEIPVREQIEQAEQALYRLVENGEANRGLQTFDKHLTRAIETAAKAYERDGGLSGVSTGLADLDRKLGGLHPSDLIILAARPSMGKSSLAANIAFHAARRYAYELMPDGTRRPTAGGVVAFFSLEMSGEQLALRIVGEVSGVPSDRIRKGEIDALEFGRIRDASIEIESSPLHIDDTGGLTVAKLAARARRLKRTTGLHLIVVDYLQLLTCPGRRGEGRVQEVTEITQGLKALAKELDVPVLALSQLSRQVENRDDKKPQLADLRESGSIEQDADVVMFLYREEYYLGRAEPKAGSPEHLAWLDEMDQCRGLAELIIGKQRHGPIGTVRLAFNADLTKFGDLAREGRHAGVSRLDFVGRND